MKEAYAIDPPSAEEEISRDSGVELRREDDYCRLIIKPFLYQAEFINKAHPPAKRTMLAWGTKAGKTTSMIMKAAALLWTQKEKRYRWIAPFHAQSSIAEGRLVRALPKGYYKYQRMNRTIIGPRGSVLTFHSGERPDTLPGEDVDGAILDEAARLRIAVYEATVSTVLATDGWICAISTPTGKNWFYRECMKGMKKAEDYFFKRYTSRENPTIAKKTLDLTERSMAKYVYDQLVLAQFRDEGTGVFQGIENCASTYVPHNAPEPGKAYVISVDLGKENDYTVAIVWDVFDSQLVYWWRQVGVPYPTIEDKIYEMSRFWNNAFVYPERNAPGAVVIDHLIKRGTPVGAGPDGKPGVYMTAGLKPSLVHSWSMALLNQEVIIPAESSQPGAEKTGWPDFYAEHLAYEYSITTRGQWQFAAPPNEHDDIVASCIIGWWALQNSQAAPRFWRPGLKPYRRRDRYVVNE